MDNELIKLASSGIGQGRAPNTIKLRPKYDEYVVDQQTNGKDPIPFAQWVKQNYPNAKILTN